MDSMIVQGGRLFFLYVHHPQDYLWRPQWPLTRYALALNHRRYGTLLCMSVHLLATDFKTLQALLAGKWQRQRPEWE